MNSESSFSFNKSQIYDFTGIQSHLDENAKTFDGKPFFRKMTLNNAEKRIASILKYNPHPNIVSIYDVSFDHIDIELVNPIYDITYENKTKIQETFRDVKSHLQTLGIIYMDWKYDNIGVSQDGEFKLFDFDCSGIASLNQKEKLWELAPFNGHAYRKCKEMEIISPFEMDNFTYQHFNLQF